MCFENHLDIVILNEHVHIILKGANWHWLRIELDLDGLLSDCGYIECSLLEKCKHVISQPIHAESLEIEEECHLSIRLSLLLDDGWRANRGEIVAEFLSVFEATHVVDCLNLAVGGEDEHQLESEPIASAHCLDVGIIVIRGCAEVTENHLRNPDAVLRVLFHVNSVAVIHNRDESSGSVNFHFDVLDWVELGCVTGTGNKRSVLTLRDVSLHSHLVVASIHNTLIKTLVNSGNLLISPVNHLGMLRVGDVINNPVDFLVSLGGSNVSVRLLEHVLAVGHHLVLIGEVFGDSGHLVGGWWVCMLMNTSLSLFSIFSKSSSHSELKLN